MTDTAGVSSIVGVPRTVLVAPDSFKGSFTASEVANAIARGLERDGRTADLCPIADGGEGTLEALVAARGGELRPARVSDPLGREVEAEFALNGSEAFVESAAASGLHLVSGHERDPLAASTAGTGELILAAVEAGARVVRLGVGGTATTDGGAGAIRAIRAGGGLRGCKLVVLCDVRTPFEDSARVFGPQKGATSGDVRRLKTRLNALARRMDRDPRGIPMTGAGGGLSGGLWAVFDAELVPGASFVLDAIGFDPRMRAAYAVITGEGRLDAQSLAGKAVSEIATRARQAGVPCHAIVGANELDSFGARILDLETVSEAGTLEELEAAGAAWARSSDRDRAPL
jgi:glycerate 2-kinase